MTHSLKAAPPAGRLADLRDELAERGFVSLGVMLEPDQIAALNEELAQRRLPVCEYGVLSNQVWRWHRGFESLVRAGELASWARALLDVPEVVLFQDNLISKPPGTRARLEWHQDYSYWPLAAPAGLTFWLALDDADRENGCLHYVPGTHLEGERQAADFTRGSGQPPLPGLTPLHWEGRQNEALAAPARAGEVWVHHPLTWHMSPVNAAQRQRRAWSLTWIAGDLTWDPAHAPHPFNYELSPRPGDPVQGPTFPRFPA